MQYNYYFSTKITHVYYYLLLFHLSIITNYKYHYMYVITMAHLYAITMAHLYWFNKLSVMIIAHLNR